MFFVISGYFLGQKLYVNNDKKVVTKKYLERIAKLFLLWFVLYFPALVARGIIDYKGQNLAFSILSIVQEIIFKCPAYLWYLVALMVGVYPAVYLYQKNKAIALSLATILYVIGCFGNTYLYLPGFSNIWEPYLCVFLTTRNGIFFAFPFLTLGIFLYGKKTEALTRRNKIIGTFLAWLIFATEVSYASEWFHSGNDCSMYFSMPVVVVFIFGLCKDARINIEKRWTLLLRKLSTWIYCSQYFFITACAFITSKIFNSVNNLVLWVIITTFDILAFCIMHKFIPKLENVLV